MNKKTAKPKKPDPLRAAAETQLVHAPKPEPRPAEELLHELQVHQIEREMQNEQLRSAQLSLEESRDRYADLYEFAPLGYFTLTDQGLIGEINLTGASLLDVERNKLLRQRFGSFVAPEHRDRWNRLFVGVLRRDERQCCELSLQRGDGSLFHARLDCLRQATGGKPPEVRIALTDITHFREAQNQLQATLDAIPDLLFEVGLDGRIYGYHSPRPELLAAPPEVFPGKTFSDVFPVDAVGVIMSAISEALKNGFSAGKQYPLQLAQGKSWFELSVSRKPATQGQESRFIMLARDISGRKQAEQQQRDLAAHLQAAREEEKAGIAREIHDDLGGTLLTLKMETHWLKTELPANGEATALLDHVEVMSQAIDHAAGIMRNIITGLRPPILDEMGLLAALEWKAAQFQRRNGIRCRVNCIGDKGGLDKLRSISLFRIAQEALSNVAKHSGASSVEIEFLHSDGEILMSIIDDGRGMKEQCADGQIHYGLRGMTERVEQLGGMIGFARPEVGGFSVTVILLLSAETAGAA